MTRLLFLCRDNSILSPVAEFFAASRGMPDLEVLSAGLVKGALHPDVAEVMREIGADLSTRTARSLDDVREMEFDFVVAMTPEAEEHCPVLPGHPAVIPWDLRDPDSDAAGTEESRRKAFRELRDRVRRLVEDLFGRGYFAALLSARQGAALLLDSVSDGILAHDMERRIFHFNRAAEQITGYRRSEVLGRDCHAVFDGRLCSGKCQFEDGCPAPMEVDKEEIELAMRDGERRTVQRSTRLIRDSSNRTLGVLLMLNDITRERSLARRVGEIRQFAGICGRDKKMLEVFDLIRDVADTNMPVLIQGESGTGKELVAAAIHNQGPRASKQFVPVNCGALPEALLESELFGHVKGAFTGAYRDKKGRFELANGGTIFLDEIGDITPPMQVKLLRVLQEGTFERVGSEQTLKANVRVISATNKDLMREIAEGRFREDLYYRLNVVPVYVPPLRERPTDIPLLVEHILKRAMADNGRKDVSLAPETLDVLLSHNWPGNVRELQNWLQFAMFKCRGSVILPEHLPPGVHGVGGIGRQTVGRKKLDAEAIRRAIEQSNGNKVEAARLLGISRATLYRMLGPEAAPNG